MLFFEEKNPFFIVANLMDIKTQWSRKIPFSFYCECHVAFVINEKSPKDNRFTLCSPFYLFLPPSIN